MPGFWTEVAVPLLAVSAVVAGLTALLFDVPPETRPDAAGESVAPPTATRTAPSAHGPMALGAAREAPAAPIPRPQEQLVGRMNEVMAEALRNLASSGAGQPNEGSNQTGPVGQPAPGAAPANEPAVDPALPATMSRLADAVQAARDARDERDLARAEQMLRETRVQMERSCAEPNSPLCQSAEQMRKLGY